MDVFISVSSCVPVGQCDAIAEHAQLAWIVPARQMGMPRDPLVAALFGPAREVP